MGFLKKVFFKKEEEKPKKVQKSGKLEVEEEIKDIPKDSGKPPLKEDFSDKKVSKISDSELREIMKEEMKINLAESKKFEKEIFSQKKNIEENDTLPKKILDGKYIRTFIPGMDELISPGIPEGSSVLVEGGPGSGKTLFCLTLLREQCLRGKKVLYMSFEEPEEKLREHINQIGLNAEKYEKKGLLYLKRFNALDIARSVEALLGEAKKELLIEVQPVLIPKEFKPDIILVDSLTSISSAFSGESSRFRVYMEQLFRYLEGNKITSFLIREVGNPTHIGGTFVEEGEAVSFLSDGIIVIYSVFKKTGVRKRAIELIKMRGVDINRKIVEYEITGKGVFIYPKKIISGDYKLT